MTRPKIYSTLQFQDIQKKISHYCQSPIAKIKVEQMVMSHDLAILETWQDETSQAFDVLTKDKLIPVSRLADLTGPLKRLELEASLNAKEIADIGKLLKSVSEIIQFYNHLQGEELSYPALEAWFNQLLDLKEVRKLIEKTVDEAGQVLSSASAELASIRRKQVRIEEQVRSQLNNILKSKAKYLSDSLITVRNNRYVIPVKAEYRYQFGGSIHDQSSTGQTLYIEPQAVMTLNNQRTDLQTAERKEIDRILLEISTDLMPYHLEISLNQEIVGQLDFIQARAYYGKEINGVKASFSQEQHVALFQARHPLIDPKDIVANDIIIGDQYRALIITGPNTGGKTILLKTLGLIQMMGQTGLLVPCDFGSQLGVFDQIFADIGDEQSIEQSLSTFSSHMTNIISIMDTMTHQSLVLLDELGSGTDPQEGAALAMAILDYLRSYGVMVMATTHYPELKVYAHDAPSTINASMEFDSDTLSPTYRLLIGIPGRSNALEISQRLGLPQQIIQTARQGISLDSQSANEMIAKLERERRLAEQEALKAQEFLAEAEKIHSDLRTEYQRYMSKKDELIEKAKIKANQKVMETQEEAEKVLQEIRDLQLEQGQEKIIKEHVLIDKKSKFDQLKQPEHLRKNRILKKAKEAKAFKIGDDVEVLSYGQRGTIIDQVDKNTYVVQMGILKMKIPKEELKALDKIENKAKVNVNVQRQAGSKVQTSLDLRGYRYDAAMRKTSTYLDQALLSHHPMVTIVHGKGTGALRQGIQELLRNHPQVDRFEFAPPNAGGNGATVVYFK